MSVKIFLSTVSDEFRRYRDVLRSDLTRHNVEVKVLEDFTDLGGETLDKLDVYIAHCDAVVHLVGDMTGAYPGERGLSALLTKYPDLPAKLLPLGTALKDGSGLSYTQWEAWLALYHRKLLLIAEAEEAAERERQYPPTDASRTAQDVHLARLSACPKGPRRPLTDQNGPLSNPTPAVQLWRREPPNLPHCGHWPRLLAFEDLGRWSDSVGGALECGDVDALHLHHRVEGPSCPIAIGITDPPDNLARNDLPRHAEAVFHPAALLGLGDGRECVGEAIGLGLGLHRYLERDRFIELE